MLERRSDGKSSRIVLQSDERSNWAPEVGTIRANACADGRGRGGDAAAQLQMSGGLQPPLDLLAPPDDARVESGVPPPSVVEHVVRRHRAALVRSSLVTADLFALVGAFLASWWISGRELSAGYAWLFVFTLPLWFVALALSGLYDEDFARIGHSTLDEIPVLLRVSTIGTWSLLVLAWAVGVAMPPVGSIVSFWVGTVLGLAALRFAARSGFHRVSTYPQRMVILGAGSVGQLLARKLGQHPEYRVQVVGFVDDRPKEREEQLGDLTILGGLNDLPRLIEALAVDRVAIAFSNDPAAEIVDSIRLLKSASVRIDIVPRLFEAIPPRLTSHTIEGIPLISLPPLRRSRFVKRAFDLAVAAAIALVLAPVFLLIAVLIRLDSPGPVIIRQLRIGERDRPFRMLKFRTMSADAEARKHEVAHLNLHRRNGDEPRLFKAKRDPRVTRVGRLLRRHSLDELPQLINVLVGTMSLVGPRPLIPEENRYVEAWGRQRLLVKPGMTGLWQVLGRSAIPFEEMVSLDYLYVTSWSFIDDCQLLARTIPLVLRGDPPEYC